MKRMSGWLRGVQATLITVAACAVIAATPGTLLAAAFQSTLSTWQAHHYPNGASRDAPTLVLDPVGRRALLFGGFAAGAYRNDVLTLALDDPFAQWAPLETLGTPPSARSDATGFYDPVRRRVLIYGGVSGTTAAADVWALSLDGAPTWSRVETQGTPPTARTWAMVVYDSRRDRLVLFGAYDVQNFTQRADLWALTLADPPTWTMLDDGLGVAPAGRYGYGAAYDSLADVLWITSGRGASDYGDSWTFAFSGTPHWSPVTTTGAPLSGENPSWTFDPIRRRLQAQTILASVQLQLATGAWGAISEVGHVAFSDQRQVWDTARDRVLAAGGTRNSQVQGASFVGDFDGAATLTIKPFPSRYIGRLWYQAAAWDAARARMVVTGGSESGWPTSSEWRVMTCEPSPVGESFVEIPTSGPGPGIISQHGMVYDSTRNRFLIFGGTDANGYTYRDGLWQLVLTDSARWQLLQPAGPRPVGRVRFSMVHDPVGDRAFVYGGWNGSALSDLWELRLSPQLEWVPLSATGPGPRCGHGAVWDPRRQRMVLYGGTDGTTYPADAWVLDANGAPAWSPLPTIGASCGRRDMPVIMDAPHDRMIVDGGQLPYGYDVYSDSALALRFDTPTPSWQLLARMTTHSRYGHSIALDPVNNRLLSTEGRVSAYGMLGDFYSLGLESPLGAPEPRTASSRLRVRPLQNGSTGPPRMVCELVTSDEARLDLVDVGGRRVAAVRLPGGRAGAVTLDWPVGAAVQPGLYFARLVQGTATARAKIVITH